jgi:hypothetical protein
VEAKRSLAARDERIAEHCREGFALTQRDPTYHAAVRARLQPDLVLPAEDLWTAIPWIWACVLGAESARGALASQVESGALLLRTWLVSDSSLPSLELSWTALAGKSLSLGSAMRSHPFSDLRAWSIRATFAEL